VNLEDAYDEEVSLLYRKFESKVLGFLCGLGCDRGLAEEITVDSFMTARRRWAKVRDYDRPECYVFKVARNERRKRQKEHDDHARDLHPDPPEAAGVPGGDLAQQVADRAALLQALRQLPPAQREAVLLRDYMGLSEVDAAAMMNVSKGTVKSNASRGRSRLRDLLGEFRPGKEGTGDERR
jgi:RNA polymerase sigma factor (sigma-70 family)